MLTPNNKPLTIEVNLAQAVILKRLLTSEIYSATLQIEKWDDARSIVAHRHEVIRLKILNDMVIKEYEKRNTAD